MKELLDKGEKVVIFCRKSEFGVYDKLARKIGLNLEASIRSKSVVWVSNTFKRNRSLFGSLPLTDEPSQLWPSATSVPLNHEGSLQETFSEFFEKNEIASKKLPF